MISVSIFPGRYVQGAGAIKKLGIEMARYGKSGYLICDPFVYDNLLPDFKKNVEEELKIVTKRFHGECSDEEISEITKAAQSAGIDLIAGIGGGKTLDTAKAVAFNLKVPVVVVPTIASTDAPCSALSVIYTPQGEFKRYMFFPSNPNMVLVDTEIIARAPARFLRCGIGDALATWFEADSCQRTVSPNMSGYPGSMTAQTLARLCYDTLLEYGQTALVTAEANVVTPALEHVVEACILLSGLGFESGGLAASHAIHNGLTVLKETHHLFHGEKVAFGVLASLFLTDRPGEIIDEVYDFCQAVGLPTTFEDMGMSGLPDSELMKVGVASCAEGETIHNEAGEIKPEDVVAALKTADGEGMRRRFE
ncbi:MAG TPA: glycerol dehydrogenase [Bacteroidales bacterium]|nr:glycerol dehydrogenase [Bacteroidales bacterium]